MQLFAIFDRKLKEYGHAIQAERNASAFLRGITDGIKRSEGSLLHSHPEDFDIMCMGEFNKETGEIKLYPSPRLIENLAVSLRAAEPPRLKIEDVANG